MRSLVLFFLFLAGLMVGAISVYLLVKDELIQKISLAAMIIILVFSLILIYFQTGHLSHSLRKKLTQAETLLQEGNSEKLKEAYLKTYQFYLRLSEKQKENFYSRIDKLREKIELMFKAEKEVKAALQEMESKTQLSELKESYQKIYAHYQSLPEKMRLKYYPQLMDLKNKLEQGN